MTSTPITSECGGEGARYMQRVLRDAAWGVLVMIDGDRPYAVPMNHAYVNGRILLHGALEGRKLDCIRRSPNVSYVVARQDAPVADDGSQHGACHLDCDSVLCVGRARIVDDLAERAAVLNEYARWYNPAAGELSAERVGRCAAIEITVTEMTARRERGRKTAMFGWKDSECRA